MNKKGFLDDMMDFLFLVVGALLVFALVFGVLGEISSNRVEETNPQVERITGKTNLLAYLRVPVEGTNMADLIVLAEKNPELREKVVKKTEEIIFLFNDQAFSGILIYYPIKEGSAQDVISVGSEFIIPDPGVSLVSPEGKEIKVYVRRSVKKS